jgi:sugar lactone lactonase YvrE
MSASMAELAFESHDALGEGPCWDPRTKHLYWVDLLAKTLLRGDPSSGRVDVSALPYAASRVTVCDDDRLLVSFLRRPGLGRFGVERFDLFDLGDAVADKQRFNDGACDSYGRFWTASYDGSLATDAGRLVCIEGMQAMRKSANGLRIPNGIRFSPDEKTMTFVDSRPGRVWTCSFDVESAHLGAWRLHIDYEGTGVKPDGCAIDIDGCLWIAEVNASRIARYTPDGRFDRAIEVPTSKPTSVTFGGDDRRTLYITTRVDGLTPHERSRQPLAGSVFAATVPTAGLPEHPFKTNTLEKT